MKKHHWAISTLTLLLVHSVAMYASAEKPIQPDLSFDGTPEQGARSRLESMGFGLDELALGIDAKILGRLIADSLEQVALRELSRHLSDKTVADSKPARDFARSLAGAARAARDPKSASTDLAYALVRAGFVKIVADALDSSGATLGCRGTVDLLNTTYEAFAASQYTRKLGFVASDASVPDSCVSLAEALRDSLNVAFSMGPSVSAILEELVTFQKSTDDYFASCPPLASEDEQNLVKHRTVGGYSEFYSKLDSKHITPSDVAATKNPDACRHALSGIKAANMAFLGQFGTSANVALSRLVESLQRANKITQTLENRVDWVDALTRLIVVLRATDQEATARREDLVLLVRKVTFIFEKSPPSTARSIVLSALHGFEYGLKVDKNEKVVVDSHVVVSNMLGELASIQRSGLYLRATIGAGYALQVDSHGTDSLSPALYEEIGGGYRFGSDRILQGPHLIASGLLFKTELDESTNDRVFFGAGYSWNLYRVLDLSVSSGAMSPRNFSSSDWNWALLAGVQLPLGDYLQALWNDEEDAISSDASVTEDPPEADK